MPDSNINHISTHYASLLINLGVEEKKMWAKTYMTPLNLKHTQQK